MKLIKLIVNEAILVQVMAWYCPATSHYQSQCWSRSTSPYGVTRPHWVKLKWKHEIAIFWNMLFLDPRIHIDIKRISYYLYNSMVKHFSGIALTHSLQHNVLDIFPDYDVLVHVILSEWSRSGIPRQILQYWRLRHRRQPTRLQGKRNYSVGMSLYIP